MPDFLATVTDRTGKRETQRVHADNSQQAFEFLLAHGCTDIVLHTDDVGAIASATLAQMYPHETSKVSPETQVQIRGLSGLRSFLLLLRTVYSQVRWILVGSAALLLFAPFSNSPFLTFSFAVLFILFPAMVVGFMTLVLPARKYKKMIEALAWGRWQEVLKRSSKLHGRIPDSEWTRVRACAFAGMGKLDEARAEWSKFENSAEIPRWLYLTQLADILLYGREYEASLQCLAQAFQEDPANPTLKLDYAMALLNAESDTDLARQLIEDAKQQHLSDLLVLVLPSIEGLLALNSADYNLAIERFESARKELLPLAVSEPLVGSMVDTIQAYLAIALAQSGQTLRAAEEAKGPRARLQAKNTTRLLKRLDKALGTY